MMRPTLFLTGRLSMSFSSLFWTQSTIIFKSPFRKQRHVSLSSFHLLFGFLFLSNTKQFTRSIIDANTDQTTLMLTKLITTREALNTTNAHERLMCFEKREPRLIVVKKRGREREERIKERSTTREKIKSSSKISELASRLVYVVDVVA